MEGKVFAITGAGSGIGKATAIRLAELGAKGIAISDLDIDGLQDTRSQCSQYSTTVTITKVDVSDSQQVNVWLDSIIADFGKLDGAANVAGIATGNGQSTENIDQASWEKMLAVNLTGVMNCMRAELQKISRPGGSIVNVSSTSGLRGLANNAAYASSKFGVIGLTESAAAEYGKLGVRVNALLPGPIDTKIFREGEAKGLFNADIISGGTLMGRMGKAEEVAKVLVFLLSNDASYVTGGEYFEAVRPPGSLHNTDDYRQHVGLWMGDIQHAGSTGPAKIEESYGSSRGNKGSYMEKRQDQNRCKLHPK